MSEFPPLLHEVMLGWARERPSSPALVFDREVLTYGDLADRSGRLAGALARRGVGRGDLVAVMLHNRPEMAVVQYALARLGAVIVPISTALRGDTLAHPLRNSGAATAIVDAELLPRVESALRGRGGIRRMVLTGGTAEGCELLEDLVAETEPVELEAPAAWDLWAVMYTSGTTGPAKGVMMSHHMLATQCRVAADIMATHPASVSYTFAPLYHLQAIVFGMGVPILLGSRGVVRERFQPEAMLDDIRSEGATFAVLPPFLLLGILQRGTGAPTSLEVVATIGLTEEQWRACEAALGARLVSMYGPTETGLITRFMNDGEDRAGTSGRRSTHVEVEIVDEHDRVLGPGQTGEVVCRPRSPFEIMQGYLGMPDKTVEAWRNLWFHTGDAGWFDEGGHFHFADRTKDMIKRRGYSISSFDVEQALLKFEGVADAAVVPYRLDGGEEEVRAFIVARAGAEVDLAALVRFANANLAHYMVPRYVDVVSVLPRNQLGKLEKFRLKAEPLVASTWDRKRAGVELER